MNFDKTIQPFLQGEKVVLRPLSEEDADGRYPDWFNDAEVCAGNSHHVYPYTREQALEFIRSLPGKQNTLLLAIIDKANGTHVGNISLQNIHFINKSAELAIILGEKNYWRKGIGKEAAQLIVEHGFKELNLYRIWSGTLEYNIGFQNIAKFIGMQHEGTRRKAAFKNGEYHDILEYGLLRDEFEKKIPQCI